MGWLYGNTIVDTNNSIETPSYQFDRIFSNYYLAQKTQTIDNIFLGRKILIDYNQPLEETLTRIEPRPEGGYYYWKGENAAYTAYDIVTTASMPIGTIAYMITSEPDEKGELKNITHLLECVSEEKSGNDDIAIFTDVTDENYNNFTNIFEYNRWKDSTLESNQGFYDSTVWQKVYIGNEIKYIMIATLNATNPAFNLQIKPPGRNGLASAPVINRSSNDVYDLILSMQPGFRINTDPYVKVNVYRPNLFYYKIGNEKNIDNNPEFTPGRDYYLDADCEFGIGKFFYNYEPNKFYRQTDKGMILDTELEGQPSVSTAYYLECSDEKANFTEYVDNNTIDLNSSNSAAIYYNKAGFEKETRSMVNTEAIPNSITVKMNGHSGYSYDEVKYYEVANINADNYDNINKENLYYTPYGGTGYQKDDGTGFNASRTYFYLVKSNPNAADTNQLSIYLPSIGNMVSEGWDKLYGEERNLNQYEYNYDTNKYTGENPNLSPDNLTGLYNLMVQDVSRLKGYDENFSTTILDNIAKSVPLQMSTDENGFKRVIELESAQTLQSQIAATNVSVQNIAKCVGLEIPSDQYKEVVNVTQDSYAPGVYYIQTGDNKYELDTSEQFSNTKKYYTCRALQIKLADGETVNLQDQINQNQTKNNTNTANLEHRLADIKEIAGLVGIGYKENAANYVTDLSDLELTKAGNKNSLTNQIDRNDNDIAQLMENIGLSRKSSIDEEGSIEKLDDSLIDQITYTNYDIAKLVAHIQRIEKFLADGHFLFTFGRSIKEYKTDGLPPMPTEDGYNKIEVPTT